MSSILAIALIAAFIAFCVHYGRKEAVDEQYEDIMIDLNGRFDWAKSRKGPLPFGMDAQLQNSWDLMHEAQELWKKHKWHDAYRRAKKAQDHMNQAQTIYSDAIQARQADEKRKAAQAEATADTADESTT